MTVGFEGLKKGQMDACVKRFTESPGMLLVDVREADEYASGHIPGAINAPLSDLENDKKYFTDKRAYMMIHCRSGVRSAKAVKLLSKKGYEHLMDIGGILDFTGKQEK